MNTSDFSPDLLKADHFLAQGRHADAEPFLRDALAADPDDPHILGKLSLCLHCLGRLEEAREIIGAALRQMPESADLHAQEALLLSDLERFSEAMKAAEYAISLDPDSALGYAAQSEVYAAEHSWPKAEGAARAALERNPEHLLAQNVLSQALLMQDKRAENEASLRARLEEDPENPYTHCNAGRAALRAGDLPAAQRHFREALRLDPTVEEARQGLLEAFRARSPFYRVFLNFSFHVSKFSRKGRLWLVLGVLFGYQILFQSALTTSPILALTVALLYLSFVLWSFVGRGLGTLIVLTDRVAYNALTPAELREGIFGGGSFIAGGIVVLVAMATRQIDVGVWGLAIAASSLPLAVMFRNHHPRGARLYPAIAAFVVACVAAMLIDLLNPGLLPLVSFSGALIATAVAVAVTTWLVNFGVCFESR